GISRRLAAATGSRREAKRPGSERLPTLLGGPPSEAPLADAVARGIAGVLLAGRFELVVTDLGAGPELARVSVGGVLNPADVCVVLSDGTPVPDMTALRIEEICVRRNAEALRVLNERGRAREVAAAVAERLATAAV
ncbi:MAG: hypothetical protein M3123_07445, partial [Actinomycetota bacterium]|nr:hypothetical protein [Actinomycetota bacterium]